MKNQIRADRFRKNRGGHSRLLTLGCGKCQQIIGTYQKDGVSSLKRLYLDRMNPSEKTPRKSLKCAACGTRLGVLIVYKKEKRLAYRLVPGAVMKQAIEP